MTQETCPWCAERSKHDMAVDLDTGAPLPFTGPQVRAKTIEAVDADDSVLICAVLAWRGELLIHVLGEPTEDVLQVLERATEGYRRVLKGHA